MKTELLQQSREEVLGSVTRVRERPLVLVVEDHDDTRLLLKTLLELRGVSVVEAGGGEEAVALFERERPDLVLMDAVLPGMDGLAATRRMRCVASLKAVPIIFLSGRAEPDFRTLALEAGCDGYLTKPLHIREIDGALAQHLSREG